MHGLENRLKSPHSLAEKIKKKLAADPSRNVHTISSSLTDFIRYTVVAAHASDVVPTARTTITTLTQQGWTLKELEHSYIAGNPYKGLHSILLENSTGQDVEIQFHAEDGIAIKDRTTPNTRSPATLTPHSLAASRRTRPWSTRGARWPCRTGCRI